MHSTFVVGTITTVSKIKQLKVFVVPFFPPTLLVSNEKVHLPQQVVEVHCWELQLVVFHWLENVVVLVVEPPHEQVVEVLLIIIAF
jgi:hypothetical protein